MEIGYIMSLKGNNNKNRTIHLVSISNLSYFSIEIFVHKILIFLILLKT